MPADGALGRGRSLRQQQPGGERVRPVALDVPVARLAEQQQVRRAVRVRPASPACGSGPPVVHLERPIGARAADARAPVPAVDLLPYLRGRAGLSGAGGGRGAGLSGQGCAGERRTTRHRCARCGQRCTAVERHGVPLGQDEQQESQAGAARAARTRRQAGAARGQAGPGGAPAPAGRAGGRRAGCSPRPPPPVLALQAHDRRTTRQAAHRPLTEPLDELPIRQVRRHNLPLFSLTRASAAPSCSPVHSLPFSAPRSSSTSRSAARARAPSVAWSSLLPGRSAASRSGTDTATTAARSARQRSPRHTRCGSCPCRQDRQAAASDGRQRARRRRGRRGRCRRRGR